MQLPFPTNTKDVEALGLPTLVAFTWNFAEKTDGNLILPINFVLPKFLRPKFLRRKLLRGLPTEDYLERAKQTLPIEIQVPPPILYDAYDRKVYDGGLTIDDIKDAIEAARTSLNFGEAVKIATRYGVSLPRPELYPHPYGTQLHIMLQGLVSRAVI